MNNFQNKSFALGVVSFMLLATTPFAFAYVASSSNYRIQIDSVDSGGSLATSTSYTVEDTLGESGVGTSSSASYQVKAGYQQMQEVYLAVSLAGNITLAPNIPAVGGGVADGAATWTVTTDNAAGYTMDIRASTSPALVSGADSFPDYIPAGTDPDFTFTTPAPSSRFGFTVEGVDIVNQFKDNGATCNTGVGDTLLACWMGLSTTPFTIAGSPLPNHPAGTATTLRFRASSGATNVQPSGSYKATTTLTVFAL